MSAFHPVLPIRQLSDQGTFISRIGSGRTRFRVFTIVVPILCECNGRSVAIAENTTSPSTSSWSNTAPPNSRRHRHRFRYVLLAGRLLLLFLCCNNFSRLNLQVRWWWWVTQQGAVGDVGRRMMGKRLSIWLTFTGFHLGGCSALCGDFFLLHLRASG